MKSFKAITLALVLAMIMLVGVSTPDTSLATALSADRSAPKFEGVLTGYPVYQSTTIYHGALVCINSTGYAIPCTDTANLICVGMAQGKVDNSSGADGAKTVEVISGYVAKFNATSITQAMVGSPMYVADDNTFDNTSTNLVLAGVLVDYDSATVGWIRLPEGESAAANANIADSGSLITGVNLETALAEAFTHIQSSQAFIPIGLTTLRETDATNVPNLANHGGQLASDSTPVLDYTNGDTDSALRLAWAASNSDPVAFQTPLPPDLNTGATVAIHFRAAMAGTTDSPVLASDCYFNEGDTKVEDGVTITGTSYAEYTISIAAADVPSGAQTMTCELTTGTHTTDIQYITAIWIEYSRSTLTQ